MLDFIHGFWHGGPLSTMERMSIQSYLNQGHKFVLHSYGRIPGVPPGTDESDAGIIVPERDISRFRNLANFSDWFRWNCIAQRGGYWADLDTVALRPLPSSVPYCFGDGDCAKGKNRVGAGSVKMPSGSPLARWLVKRVAEMDTSAVTDFSAYGPTLLMEGINRFNLRGYLLPNWAFLPVNVFDAERMMAEDIPLPPECYVVHLYHNLWKERRHDPDSSYAPDSLYERLRRSVFEGRPSLTFHAPRKNILIAVVTCQANQQKAEAQFDSWGLRAREAGYDVCFFDGEALGVPDGPYIPAITDKAAAIYRYALERRYDYLLKCDDDCYLNVERLRVPGGDYAGIPCGPNDGGRPQFGFPDYPARTHPHVFASGGAAWFSRKALAILADLTPIAGDWADDRWAGQVLARAGVPVEALPDYFWYPAYPKGTRDFAAVTQLPTADHIRAVHYCEEVEPYIADPLNFPESVGEMLRAAFDKGNIAVNEAGLRKLAGLIRERRTRLYGVGGRAPRGCVD